MDRRKSSADKLAPRVPDHEEISKLLAQSTSDLLAPRPRMSLTSAPRRRHSDQGAVSGGRKINGSLPTASKTSHNRSKSLYQHRTPAISFAEDVGDQSDVFISSESLGDTESVESYGSSTLSDAVDHDDSKVCLERGQHFRKSSLKKKSKPSSLSRRVHLQLDSLKEEPAPVEDESTLPENNDTIRRSPEDVNGAPFPIANGVNHSLTQGDDERGRSRRAGLSFQESPVTPIPGSRHVFFSNLQDSHELFVQMNEWEPIDPQDYYSDRHWKEKVRWIKFEEDWEEGAEKWGKPHVAQLTFNSLPQLRRCLQNGLVLIDSDSSSLTGIVENILNSLQDNDIIQAEDRVIIDSILFQNIKCYMSDRPSRLRSSIRRLSTITDRRRQSAFNVQRPQGFSETLKDTEEIKISVINHVGAESTPGSPSNQGHFHPSHLMKKIPEDSEAAAILVAQDENLDMNVFAFVRFAESRVFDGFVEVPIPLRFLCILMGPAYSPVDFHEVGRAMGTLFSDDLFRDIAYTARDKDDIMIGINEFLNNTMVLPPGDWDRELLLPITRIQKKEQEKVLMRRKSLKPPQEDMKDVMPTEKETLYLVDPLQRTGRPFGGLINDIKRRYPHMLSDYTDAINFHCLATFFFVFFACVAPAITFGGILGEKTNNWMGVSEMMVSTSICGMVFALFSGQPLVIIGGTGPVLVFEEYLYLFCHHWELELLPFRAWIGVWVFVIATVVVVFEGSILVRYFTRFTEEILAALISLIFIFETYEGLHHIFHDNPVLPDYCTVDGSNSSAIQQDQYLKNYSSSPKMYSQVSSTPDSHVRSERDVSKVSAVDSCREHSHGPEPNVALMSFILTFGTFFIAFFLRMFTHSKFLHRDVRRAIGDFSIAIAICTMVLVDTFMKDAQTQKLCIPEGVRPTKEERDSWFVNPMGLKENTPVLAVFGAVFPAFLVFILLYMETLLTGMLVNKGENKLKKGSGFHLDLFLMGVLSALAGFLGLPWMCAATIRTVSHVSSLCVMTRGNPPGVKPKLDYIIDQRLTNFTVSLCTGLIVFITPILKNVPIPVLLGVFLYLGLTSLNGLQLVDRVGIFFMPSKHHPDVNYIRQVKLWKIHVFTLLQLIWVALLWIIKNSKAAIAFPFFLILTVIFRLCLKFAVFNEMDLDALDNEEADDEAATGSFVDEFEATHCAI